MYQIITSWKHKKLFESNQCFSGYSNSNTSCTSSIFSSCDRAQKAMGSGISAALINVGAAAGWHDPVLKIDKKAEL